MGETLLPHHQESRGGVTQDTLSMTHDTATAIPKAMLVGVQLPGVPDAEHEESLVELRRLAKTLGFDVVGTTSQKRRSLSGGTVLGQGKLKTLARWTGGTGVVEKKAYVKSKKDKSKADEDQDEDDVEAELSDDDDTPEERDDDPDPPEKIDALIFDCELTPSQVANLQSATGVEVLDRTGVIVEIFSRHARTRIARLQVEVARLKYLAPRLRKAGGRGAERMNKAGETSVELDKRRIRDRIAELTQTLEQVQKEQAAGRNQRTEQPCVALVGYTNAGKSSLMRALTGSQVLVEDKLFATLDTTVRTLQPETIPKILISDTVGFIRKLPHDLVESFRSTLEEAQNAWLLLFVVDASDPAFRAQLQVTHEVLGELGTDDIPSRLVLNKCDKLTPEQLQALREEFPDALPLSAKNPADVANLRQELVRFFERGMAEEEVFVPYTEGRAVGPLRTRTTVLGERYTDDGTVFTVRAHAEDLARLRKEFNLPLR